MKVNKEEVLAMYVALERYISRDHEKDWKEWEKGITRIQNAVKVLPGISTKVFVPELGNVTPTLEIAWNMEQIKLSSKELQEKLRNGAPSIEVAGGKENSINITAWVMQPGQDAIVDRRLKEELSMATA